MIKTFTFNRILSIPYLRGYLPFYRLKSLFDTKKVEAGKKLIWRNDYASTMAITPAYMDRPVELGNLLFLRTRERDFIKARLNHKSEAVKHNNFYTTGSDKKILGQVEEQLFEGFDHLKTLLEVLETTKDVDFPVSFASNVLYSLEKNGLRNERMYRKVLFPVLKKKAQYLHGEGLAGALWALGQYESNDNELVDALLEQYNTRVFGSDLVYLKNAKYSTETYLSAAGSHMFENDSTSEFQNLYFKDHITTLELYEGLQNIATQSLDDSTISRIGRTLTDLVNRQAIISDSYSYYKQMLEAPKSE